MKEPQRPSILQEGIEATLSQETHCEIREHRRCALGRHHRHSGSKRPKSDGSDHVLSDPEIDHRLLLIGEESRVGIESPNGFWQPGISTRKRFVPRDAVFYIHFNRLTTILAH